MDQTSLFVGLTPFCFLALASCGLLTLSQPPYSLATVCERLPRDLCAVRARPCEHTGQGFDGDVCEARESAACDANVEAVRRGEMTFRADEVPACLASIESATSRAEVELHAALVAKAPCSRIFEGNLGPFDACERDAQCHQPERSDEIARCNRGQRCEVVRTLGEGESCEIDNDGNHHCAVGLVCDMPRTEGDPDVDTCVVQLKLGDACSPLADAEACGRLGTCDRSSLTCEPRRPLGSRCFSGRDCLSGHCTNEFCGPDTTFFTGLECGQPCVGSLCD